MLICSNILYQLSKVTNNNVMSQFFTQQDIGWDVIIPNTGWIRSFILIITYSKSSQVIDVLASFFWYGCFILYLWGQFIYQVCLMSFLVPRQLCHGCPEHMVIMSLRVCQCVLPLWMGDDITRNRQTSLNGAKDQTGSILFLMQASYAAPGYLSQPGWSLRDCPQMSTRIF